MKIITWNCNLNFAKKFEHLEPMDADIFIIQECEKLKEDYFPNSRFYWTGRTDYTSKIFRPTKSLRHAINCENLFFGRVFFV